MLRQLLFKSGACRRRVVVLFASDTNNIIMNPAAVVSSSFPLRISRGLTTDASSNDSSKLLDENDNDNGNDDGNDEWIPPSRPLMGDQGHSKLYLQNRQANELHQFDMELEQEEALMQIGDEEDEEEALLRLEVLLQKEQEQETRNQELYAQQLKMYNNNNTPSSDESGGDWLQTRRAVLGQEGERKDVIEVRHHAFLTQEEISTLLQSLGGKEVTTVLDDPEYARMGGAKGMVFCTGDNSFHISTLVRTLVEHLQARHLQDLGVSGAVGDDAGAEGSGNYQDPWRVVDCSNFIVHILDKRTRNHLKLEDLWSGKDPLWRLDLKNDEAVEEYIRTHPVPDDYGTVAVDWDSSLVSKLENSRWTAPHRPVIPKHGRKRSGNNSRRR